MPVTPPARWTYSAFSSLLLPQRSVHVGQCHMMDLLSLVHVGQCHMMDLIV